MAFSFGAPAASQPPTTSGFSFGGTSTQPQQQQQQQQQQQNKPAGFSFGQPPATTSTGTGTGTGGLFGSSSQPQQTGGLFSSASQQQPQQQQQQQQQPSTGLFGSTTQQQQQQQGQTSSLFGAPKPATGGLFSASQPAKPAGSGGLFGSSTSGGFSFGGASTGPGSTQTQQAPATGSSLFAQSQPAPATATATTAAAAAAAAAASVSAAQQEKKLGASLAPRLEQLRAAWDTNNAAGCRFLYYFYNNAGSNVPNLKMISTRRPDAVGPVHDQLWAAAVRENPDPERLYPVLALGFNDLKKRVGSQHAEASRQRALLSQLSARLSALEQKHSLQNTVRASAAASRQSQLHHRLVSLVAKAGMLVPALRGRSIGPEEERLIAILESCDAEITRSAANDHAASASGHARLRAKVNELWAQVGVVRAKREVLAREGRASGTEWAVVDESGLENVSKILASQQQGLAHLSKTLEADSRTMDTITQGLTGVKLVGVSSR